MTSVQLYAHRYLRGLPPVAQNAVIKYEIGRPQAVSNETEQTRLTDAEQEIVNILRGLTARERFLTLVIIRRMAGVER